MERLATRTVAKHLHRRLPNRPGAPEGLLLPCVDHTLMWSEMAGTQRFSTRGQQSPWVRLSPFHLLSHPSPRPRPALTHPAGWFLAPNTLPAIPQRLQSTISPSSRHESRAMLAPFQPANSLPRSSSIFWVYQVQIETPLSTDGRSHLCSPAPFRLRRFVAPQSVTSNPRQAS